MWRKENWFYFASTHKPAAVKNIKNYIKTKDNFQKYIKYVCSYKHSNAKLIAISDHPSFQKIDQSNLMIYLVNAF